ncbi:hypothetical protein ACFWVS_10680, partial [Streptomyces sp. NPDC058661]
MFTETGAWIGTTENPDTVNGLIHTYETGGRPSETGKSARTMRRALGQAQGPRPPRPAAPRGQGQAPPPRPPPE